MSYVLLLIVAPVSVFLLGRDRHPPTPFKAVFYAKEAYFSVPKTGASASDGWLQGMEQPIDSVAIEGYFVVGMHPKVENSPGIRVEGDSPLSRCVFRNVIPKGLFFDQDASIGAMAQPGEHGTGSTLRLEVDHPFRVRLQTPAVENGLPSFRCSNVTDGPLQANLLQQDVMTIETGKNADLVLHSSDDNATLLEEVSQTLQGPVLFLHRPPTEGNATGSLIQESKGESSFIQNDGEVDRHKLEDTDLVSLTPASTNHFALTKMVFGRRLEIHLEGVAGKVEVGPKESEMRDILPSWFEILDEKVKIRWVGTLGELLLFVGFLRDLGLGEFLKDKAKEWGKKA